MMGNLSVLGGTPWLSAWRRVLLPFLYYKQGLLLLWLLRLPLPLPLPPLLPCHISYQFLVTSPTA